MALAQRMAQGDLSARIAPRSRDETGTLRQALSDMTAAANRDVSSSTEQQASSLEETASSREALTAAVKQNDHRARGAQPGTAKRR